LRLNLGPTRRSALQLLLTWDSLQSLGSDYRSRRENQAASFSCLRRFPQKHFPAAKQSTIHTMRLADQQTQWREIRKTMNSIIAKHGALTEAQLTSIADNLNTLNPTLDFLVGLTPRSPSVS